MALRRWPFLVLPVSALLLATALGEDNPAPGQAPAASAPRPQLKLKPDVVPGDNPRVDLEVDAKFHLVLAPVTVNGVAGRFVVNTGAPNTLVTPEFAGKTGLDRAAVTAGVVGGGEDAKLSRVQSLKVGATDYANFDVRILALGYLSPYLERPADGVLGADVLLALPFTLDYSSKRLVLGRPADLSGRKELPATLLARHLVVQGTVEGEKVDFVLDTGSNLSTIARSSYRGKTEQVRGLEFAVPQDARLGDMALVNPRFVLGDRSVLGIDFFERRVVTFDALLKKIYVQTGALAQAIPAPGPAQPPGKAAPPPAKPPAATTTTAATTPPAPTQPLPPALEKPVGDLQARLFATQEEEYKLVNRIMAAQQKALDSLGLKPDELTEVLAGRRSSKAVQDYKALLAQFVQQLQAFDSKYVALQRQIKQMEADRKAAEAKPRLAQLAGMVLSQRKGLQEKMADLLEKAGDYKAAIAIYEAEIQALTELKRTAETRSVKERLAEACDKAKEPQKAVTTLKSVYDSIPPGERGQNANFMLRLAFMYEKAGDLRKALETYLEIEKVLPPGTKVKGMAEKITTLKAKVGNV